MHGGILNQPSEVKSKQELINKVISATLFVSYKLKLWGK